MSRHFARKNPSSTTLLLFVGAGAILAYTLWPTEAASFTPSGPQLDGGAPASPAARVPVPGGLPNMTGSGPGATPAGPGAAPATRTLTLPPPTPSATYLRAGPMPSAAAELKRKMLLGQYQDALKRNDVIAAASYLAKIHATGG